MVPSCKNALQQCNEDIQYKEGETAASSTTDVEDLTPCKISNILKELKDKGHVPLELLGLEEFTCYDDIESHLIHLYLDNLFNILYVNKDLEELRRKFKMESFTITKKGATFVEEHTQSSSPYWYKLRIGRITASIFKSACRANTAVSFPASLLKTICYPSHNISTAAMTYGKKK